MTKVNTSKEKSVVLTFDDGPSKILPSILDCLREENVPAIFFWQSRLLYDKRPWKRVLEEGHQIGTHSSKHVNLVNLPYENQLKDIKQSVEQIEGITGQPVKFFRPPFGQYNDDTIQIAHELDLKPVLWRISSMDWELKGNPGLIINNVVENLEDGAIILLHELSQTLEILPDLIEGIREQGYQFTLL
ncbi:polysaccharide deacetylase family protein [Salinibacillus xinjiangensis]|uniref:Polysaccharide deacetylase family protein n=1 Tax=Salinibacillus xinjiangensis TaxID=1229268 RepID=A0A6G1X5I4_9BACI|nr:polysaccharide deacetylase family protein [Salinibacillus xinjiangensis]MRG86166.1 polysaccharide deacetylase family protein [Salinibacillus xinjiangensis]